MIRTHFLGSFFTTQNFLPSPAQVWLILRLCKVVKVTNTIMSEPSMVNEYLSSSTVQLYAASLIRETLCSQQVARMRSCEFEHQSKAYVSVNHHTLRPVTVCAAPNHHLCCLNGRFPVSLSAAALAHVFPDSLSQISLQPLVVEQ